MRFFPAQGLSATHYKGRAYMDDDGILGWLLEDA